MSIEKELLKYAKADEIEEKFKYFHKTNVGGYAYKDEFLGITVPDIRKVVKNYYKDISLKDTEELLHSKYHEYRLAALIILTEKMKKASDNEQEEIVDIYLNNTDYINGWDLVDLSAHYVLGKYMLKNQEKREILYKLSKSENMWEQRISIVSTWIFIRNEQYLDTIRIAEILLNNENDLIHKAVGWMLREIGKKDFDTEYKFLKKHYKKMPRTMLRYAIEKFDENIRKDFLHGKI